MENYLVKKELPKVVKEIAVIQVQSTIGNGSEEEPYREVVSLYTKDGVLITVLEETYLFFEWYSMYLCCCIKFWIWLTNKLDRFFISIIVNSWLRW